MNICKVMMLKHLRAHARILRLIFGLGFSLYGYVYVQTQRGGWYSKFWRNNFWGTHFEGETRWS